MAGETRGLMAAIVDGFKSLINFIISLFEGLFGGRRPAAPAGPAIKSRFKRDIVRAEDLLVLQFEFINLDLEATTDPAGHKVARLIPSADAYIILRFPPQNIAEEAFFETAPNYPVKPPDNLTQVADSPQPRQDKDESSSSETPTPPPVQSRLAHLSRLVFKVPPETKTIAYDLESLLDLCARSELSVAATALPQEATPARNKLFDKGGLSTIVYLGGASAQPKSAAEKLIAESRIKMRGGFSAAEGAQRIPEAALRPSVKAVPKLKKPTELETAIEMPFRLIISPNKFAAWAHSAHLVESPLTKRVELWHTRLASVIKGEVDERDAWYRTIRAIWTRDQPFDPSDPTSIPLPSNTPFRMPLDPTDRQNIVHLTSNYDIWLKATKKSPSRRYVPLPVAVNRLMLSSLGAWLDSRGAWLPPKGSGLGVEEWEHRATLGRDHYVKVVYKGYLFPFMHRASLIKITERRFHPDIQGNTAYLRQRMLIIVREPEKLYPPTGLKNPAGHHYDLQWQVNRVILKTTHTPELDKPELSDYDNIDPNPKDANPPAPSMQAMFWPRVGNKDFLFHLIIEDTDGQQAEFTLPLLFVSVLGNIADNQAIMTMVRDDYETSPANAARREASLSGKHMKFAPSSKPGDTTYETLAIAFGAEIPIGDEIDSLGDDAPRFYPAIRSSHIIPSVTKALVGANQSLHIRYAKKYLEEGFAGGNKGEVFAEIVPGSTPIGLNFEGKGDHAGGLVMPNMNIKGLSRSMGPVAGDNLTDITAGNFKPADFFKGLNAKIFGVINLWDVIQDVSGLDNKLDLVPKFITEAFTGVEAFLQELESLKQNVDRVSAELVTMGGAAAALPAKLQADYNNLKSQVQTLISSPPADINAWKNTFTGFLNAFNADAQELKATIPLLPASVEDAKRELERIIAGFADELQNAAKIANYVTQLLNALKVPEEMKVRFEWKPALKDWPASQPLFLAHNKGTSASLTISVEVSAKTNLNSAPKANVSCLLQNFSLDLIGNVESFIIIRFSKLEFRASTGLKPDVNVLMDSIEFVGVLSFVEVLKTLIPLDGFSDPPALAVTTEGIDASFSMALPNISFGVFSLQNLSLGAGFNIPFVGKPLSVRFNFCERHSPFLLTVSLFGGGGFFGITLDPAGVQILEASFEFGASLSVDFGVASGGIYVMAGIYFRLEAAAGGDKCSLTGYVRMGGEVDVLGLISASIELNLSLTYEFSSGKCVGKATLTIEVDIAFFSISVEISAERKFAGSNGDPTFAQLMGPYQDPLTNQVVDPWREYCEAFADV